MVNTVFIGQKLFCANTGDSRAILCSMHDNKLHVKALSRDHKPDLPDEMERIKSLGGRVQSYKDAHGRGIGPKRVWIKD